MATQYNKMTISGGLPGGEVWSVGCSYKRINPVVGDTEITSYEDLKQQCEIVWDLLADMGNTTELKQLLSAGGTINKVRWEYREGPELLQAAEHSETPLAGSGTMTKTFQTALVFSLLTGRAGRSYRGRIYWPAIGAAIETTGRLNATRQSSAVNQMAEFLKDAGRRPGGMMDVDPGVYSSTLDVWTPIESVELGNVLDTQRRRRDKLVESRIAVGIPS